MFKTTLLTLASLLVLSLGAVEAQAGGTKEYSEFGVCCSEQIEVAITPVDLVSAAYQGRFVDYGIPSFAAFDQAVALGTITAEDLVRVAYWEYRATSQDLYGSTSLIKDTQNILDVHNRGR